MTYEEAEKQLKGGSILIDKNPGLLMPLYFILVYPKLQCSADPKFSTSVWHTWSSIANRVDTLEIYHYGESAPIYQNLSPTPKDPWRTPATYPHIAACGVDDLLKDRAKSETWGDDKRHTEAGSTPPKSCTHVWKTYTGMRESFDYCEKCDVKMQDAINKTPPRDTKVQTDQHGQYYWSLDDDQN